MPSARVESRFFGDLIVGLVLLGFACIFVVAGIAIWKDLHPVSPNFKRFDVVTINISKTKAQINSVYCGRICVYDVLTENNIEIKNLAEEQISR